jgi:hypothetical protein
MIQAHAFLINKAQLEPMMVQLPSNLHAPFRTNITLSWAGTPEAHPVAFELVHAPSVSMTLQVCRESRLVTPWLWILQAAVGTARTVGCA